MTGAASLNILQRGGMIHDTTSSKLEHLANACHTNISIKAIHNVARVFKVTISNYGWTQWHCWRHDTCMESCHVTLSHHPPRMRLVLVGQRTCATRKPALVTRQPLSWPSSRSRQATSLLRTKGGQTWWSPWLSQFGEPACVNNMPQLAVQSQGLEDPKEGIAIRWAVRAAGAVKMKLVLERLPTIARAIRRNSRLCVDTTTGILVKSWLLEGPWPRLASAAQSRCFPPCSRKKPRHC